MAVYVECVNVCKYPKGDGSGRYDCSPVLCAWKAPRAMTGLFASTANSSGFYHGQSERNMRHGHVILTALYTLNLLFFAFLV